MPDSRGPLTGLRVLDLSIIVAGGTASSLLADFGAEVVKVERPGNGDPLRNWGPFYNGVSLWWKTHSRNKLSITLDLSRPEGQQIAKTLVQQADLLIEGFRPGTMEGWGLGPEDLHQENPGLVMLRYSGFGQSGPYKDRPGFGTIAECMSGYIGMTGFPESPPVLPPIPLADEIAGVFGAMAGMMALYHRDFSPGAQSNPVTGRKGQVIDLSLFEPLFRLCIPHITMYDLLGTVRERVGNDFPDAAPRSLYHTKDKKWLGLSATSQNTWEGLARSMDLQELLAEPRFKDNASRLENKDDLNQILQQWLEQRSLTQVMQELVPAGGVVGPVYNISDIVDDPHYQEREDILEIEDSELGKTRMVGIVPKFGETPGRVDHAGPTLGQHNESVYGSWLGHSPEYLDDLAKKGII